MKRCDQNISTSSDFTSSKLLRKSGPLLNVEYVHITAWPKLLSREVRYSYQFYLKEGKQINMHQNNHHKQINEKHDNNCRKCYWNMIENDCHGYMIYLRMSIFTHNFGVNIYLENIDLGQHHLHLNNYWTHKQTLFFTMLSRRGVCNSTWATYFSIFLALLCHFICWHAFCDMLCLDMYIVFADVDEHSCFCKLIYMT